MLRTRILCAGTLLAILALPASALAGSGGVAPVPPQAGSGGGTSSSQTVVGGGAGPTVAGSRAKLVRGVAYAPASAPAEVQHAIWAGNALRAKPYVYGGGHRSFKDAGYDCSSTVSYALHGGGLLRSPLDSSSFMSWGLAGEGRWITIYTNPGHAYVVIAGLRLDTSMAGDPSGGPGPRWRKTLRDNAGFVVRHPSGF